jgi:hypothetical protein
MFQLSIPSILKYYNESPDEKIEKHIGYLTFSVQQVIGGRKYVYLKNAQSELSYVIEQPDSSSYQYSLSKTFFKVTCAVLSPFSLLSLAAVMLSSSRYRQYVTTWKEPAIYFKSDSLPIGQAQNVLILWEKIKEKGLVKEFLKHLLVDPMYYLIFDKNAEPAPKMKLPMLKMQECCCTNQEHNRQFASNLRNCIEADWRKQIEAMSKNIIKEENIAILSVASGDLLQDLFFLADLITRGFLDITLMLADPAISEKAYDSFLDIARELKKRGVTLHLQRFQSCFECFSANPTTQFHLVHAIDFNDLGYPGNSGVQDLLEARKKLVSRGFLYCSFGNDAFRLDATGTLESFRKNIYAQLFIEHSIKPFKEKSEDYKKQQLVIGFWDLASLFEQGMYAINDLVKAGYSNIKIKAQYSKAMFSDISVEVMQKYLEGVIQQKAALTLEFVETLLTDETKYDLLHVLRPEFQNKGLKTFSQQLLNALNAEGHLFLGVSGKGLFGYWKGEYNYLHAIDLENWTETPSQSYQAMKEIFKT